MECSNTPAEDYRNLPLIRGLEAVRKSERVYLEAYTSVLLVPKEQLVRPW